MKKTFFTEVKIVGNGAYSHGVHNYVVKYHDTMSDLRPASGHDPGLTPKGNIYE